MPKGTPFDTRGYGTGDTAVSATVGSVSSTPTYRSIDGKGGHFEVADLTARNAIPDEGLARDHPDQFRQEGMTCFVQADQTTYQLQGGIANANWVALWGAGGPGGGGLSRPTDRTNVSGGAFIQGAIVAQDAGAAKGLQLADQTTNNNLSRPVGIVTEVGGIANTAQGEIATVDGDECEVAMVAGLTPAFGDLVILSTTPGLGTIPGSGIGEPAVADSVVQGVGLVLDTTPYGGTQRLLVQKATTDRRLV